MYIEPNTIIKVFKNCPLDKSYENTLFFATLADQTAYFSGLSGYTFTQQTYQRVNKNKMRVAMNAEALYNCNYLAFQNTAFGSKWFYAFINSVDYINNLTTEIDYDIDVIQTWHFDYLLRQCMVEREHTPTDAPGDNLVPENLEIGEYISDDFDGTNQLGPKSIVVGATFDDNLDNIGGSYYSHIFSGLYYHVFPNDATGAGQCENLLMRATAEGKSNGIVCIFLMPTCMVTELLDPPNDYTITKTKKITGAIDGYIPRNKKLYTYPYNFLYVTNLQGNSAAFPYEYFGDNVCSFHLTGDMAPNPSVVLAPINYKGVQLVNYDEKMVLSGFPQLGYNVDTFKAWLAQNATSLAVNALSAAQQAYTGNMGSAVTGALGIVAQVYEHSIQPNQARGGAGSTTMAAIGIQDFAFMHKHIRAEFLAIIDGFFDMYGYALHRVKIPNRNARPEWTYTKTIGCKIDPYPTSGLPGDDMAKIESIYNAGIRWWNNPAHIGNYSYTNAPVNP